MKDYDKECHEALGKLIHATRRVLATPSNARAVDDAYEALKAAGDFYYPADVYINPLTPEERSA